MLVEGSSSRRARLVKTSWPWALVVCGMLPWTHGHGPARSAEPGDEVQPTAPARVEADPETSAGEPSGTQVDITRVAATNTDGQTRSDADVMRLPSLTPDSTEPSAAEVLDDPIVRAQRIIAECRARFEAEVRDYTCVFFKRERIDGRLTPQYAMWLKVRTEPKSVYIKVLEPDSRAGREAIYVAGRHGGKVLVHDVGFGKFLAGTLAIDPRGSRAMDGCRHPITEAGFGHMLDTLAERWAIEMSPGETEVTIDGGLKVGDRPCTRIVCTHPERRPGYMFHSVRVYIDDEHRVPIRFEAYDWPKAPGQPAELVERYSFSRLQLNVGLTDRDFDPSNARYSFGRF